MGLWPELASSRVEIRPTLFGSHHVSRWMGSKVLPSIVGNVGSESSGPEFKLGLCYPL